LGGAANVAANLAGLGVDTHLFSLCGDDPAAERLHSLLEARGINDQGVVRSESRCTTLKTRIMAGNQQVVRIDRETPGKLEGPDRDLLLARLQQQGPFSAVVVSDYGKGVVNEELMALMRAWRETGSIVVVDPKQGNFELYRGVNAITPNEKEAASACHEQIEGEADAARVGAILRRRLQTDLILLTRGENGICLLQADERVHHFPTVAREVYDVTGAGDTVIAVFTAVLAAQQSPELATRMANAAAGVAVASLGTTVVEREGLLKAWNRIAGAEE
jgi:D-beta-D-heptose 7-phosphate kinase/D-beta-D-heptose 1-phosphate adenosyltransferase